MRIVAYDQALVHTGWAALHYDQRAHVVTAFDCGEIDLSDFAVDLGGHAQTMARAVEYSRRLRRLGLGTPDVAVFETPPAGRGMARPESSLVAAALINVHFSDSYVKMEMIGAQAAKKAMTGSAKATKAQVAAVVRGRLGWGPRQHNQQITDAAALGLTYIDRSIA